MPRNQPLPPSPISLREATSIEEWVNASVQEMTQEQVRALAARLERVGRHPATADN